MDDVFRTAGFPVLVLLFQLLTLVVKILDLKRGQYMENVSPPHLHVHEKNKIIIKTFLITNLAERKADAAPACVDIVSRRTFLHTGVLVLEVLAGHTAAGITWMRTAPQTLVMAALAVEGTRAFILAH